MAVEQIETVIIGGGQAGLATSYWLKQHGREHVVLEKSGRPGHAWRQRWDSFTLVTPNWMFRLPGAEYDGADPGGFMPRDEIVATFERYVAGNALPVSFGVDVTSVERLAGPARLLSRPHAKNGVRGTERGHGHRPLPARQDPCVRGRAAVGCAATALPSNTATLPACRQAPCSSWAAASPAARSPRSCARAAGGCF